MPPTLPKKVYTGTIEKQHVGSHSHFSHTATVLKTSEGSTLKLRVRGDNPFENKALKPFIGQRVTVSGYLMADKPILTIDNIADVTVLGPPGRPSKPPRPK